MGAGTSKVCQASKIAEEGRKVVQRDNCRSVSSKTLQDFRILLTCCIEIGAGRGVPQGTQNCRLKSVLGHRANLFACAYYGAGSGSL